MRYIFKAQFKIQTKSAAGDTQRHPSGQGALTQTVLTEEGLLQFIAKSLKICLSHQCSVALDWITILCRTRFLTTPRKVHSSVHCDGDTLRNKHMVKAVCSTAPALFTASSGAPLSHLNFCHLG